MAVLERLRSELLARLAAFDSAALNRKPAAGGWSTVQVLAHVILAERLSLEYLQKKIQRPESIPRSGVISALKSGALAVFLRLPFKVSAPVRSADVPDTAELSDLEREWDEVRNGLRTFVGDLPAELAGRAIYRHPVAGRLSLEQTLRFLIEHLSRHTRQIDRLLADAA
jgi:uncharacterized damage-inducible protein DinB